MAKPPTAKQLRYLRSLANQTGTTFTPPTTAAEASRFIREMQQRNVSPRQDITADRRAVADRDRARSGTDVGASEVTGYGSSARWAHRGRS
jgi:hypothetical protein